jgi:hypothetical protein
VRNAKVALHRKARHLVLHDAAGGAT